MSQRKLAPAFELESDAGDTVRLDALRGRWVVLYEGILRTTFIIDPAGRIARVYEKVRPAEHAAELLAELEDLEQA